MRRKDFPRGTPSHVHKEPLPTPGFDLGFGLLPLHVCPDSTRGDAQSCEVTGSRGTHARDGKNEPERRTQVRVDSGWDFYDGLLVER